MRRILWTKAKRKWRRGASERDARGNAHNVCDVRELRRVCGANCTGTRLPLAMSIVIASPVSILRMTIVDSTSSESRRFAGFSGYATGNASGKHHFTVASGVTRNTPTGMQGRNTMARQRNAREQAEPFTITRYMATNPNTQSQSNKAPAGIQATKTDKEMRLWHRKISWEATGKISKSQHRKQ